ncbi:MAG: AAA family ATPase [Clostridia bacterium]|nr:AAA family ATPase [Clostridia bacterium]
MGKYLNPGNTRFKNHLKNPYYVDKSGLIDILNSMIENDDIGYLCASRPRRFGKSYVADMLTAYYSRGCDSRTQFDKLNISRAASYVRHLNKYDRIYVDVNGFLDSLDAALSTMQVLKILKKDIFVRFKEGIGSGLTTKTLLKTLLDQIISDKVGQIISVDWVK